MTVSKTPEESDKVRLSDADIAKLMEGEPKGPRRSMKAIAMVATLGGLLFGYDTAVIAGALPYMVLSPAEGGLGLTPVQEGLVTSSLLLGAAFGATWGGRLSDRFGRRHNILMLAGVFFVGAVAAALAPTLGVMIVARIVLGLAVGGASTTVPVYLAEIAPPHLRGRLVAVDQLMIVTGQLLAYTTNAVLANTVDSGSVWRWMLLICSIPAVALWIGMRYMPESSRWFAARGDYLAAAEVLKRTRRSGDAGALAECREMIQLHERDEGHGSWADLKIKWIRRLVFIGIGIAILQQTTGVNTIMYYATTILQATGQSTEVATILTIGNGLISVIGSALGLVLVSVLRRRTLLIMGLSGIVVSLAVIGLVFTRLIEPILDSGETPELSMAFGVLGGMMFFLFFQQAMVSPVTWVLLSEIFPGKVRGLAMGVAVFLLWTFNAIISFSFPIMQSAFGGATFFVFSAINVLTLLFAIRFVPETKHLSLEELEDEFAHRYGDRTTAPITR